MENNINKEIMENGEKATVVISSTDDKKVNLGNYTLANNPHKKVNRFVERYRNSMLGKDIGMKSSGFASTAIFASIISIAVLIALYISWRI